MQKADAGAREEFGQEAAVTRDVRHLGRPPRRAAVMPAQIRGVAESPDRIADAGKIVVRRVGKRVPDDLLSRNQAVEHFGARAFHAIAHLFERPCRHRPDVGQLAHVARRLAGFDHAVQHFAGVVLEDLARELREADVKVRFEYQDYLFDLHIRPPWRNKWDWRPSRAWTAVPLQSCGRPRSGRIWPQGPACAASFHSRRAGRHGIPRRGR